MRAAIQVARKMRRTATVMPIQNMAADLPTAA
jgi:hypothetical protein